VLAEGATVLCVATMAEALELRQAFPGARILVMGPTVGEELAAAREARVEVTVSDGEIPEGVLVHLKLDTGMGRWGLSELPEPSVGVVGLMTHLATADFDPEFARE
jgi:alanine racemase